MAEDKITVVDNEFYIAWCYPTQRLIHHQWQKHCVGDDFRKSITGAVEAFEKYNCFKWLSDDRKFDGVLHPDEWTWWETHFTDRAIKAGWKYFAMVFPTKAIAKMSSTALTKYFIARGVETGFFTEFEEAQKWIADVDK